LPRGGPVARPSGNKRGGSLAGPIVFVGGMVGFIVISMYLPLFSIYEHIR
jgi:hypothetical protein